MRVGVERLFCLSSVSLRSHLWKYTHLDWFFFSEAFIPAEPMTQHMNLKFLAPSWLVYHTSVTLAMPDEGSGWMQTFVCWFSTLVFLLCARSSLLKIKMLLTVHFWLLFPLGLLATLVKDLSSRSCSLDYILGKNNDRAISSPKCHKKPHMDPAFPLSEVRAPGICGYTIHLSVNTLVDIQSSAKSSH